MDLHLPLVTIVAVCYNHEMFLWETLDSIIEQTYPNIEMIIIDDCSSDNSVVRIEEWKKKNNQECLSIFNVKNIGLCNTLNKALEYCNGEYIQIISCDDILASIKIEKQINQFSINQELGLVYSDMKLINRKGGALSKKTYNDYFGFNAKSMPEGMVYSRLLETNFIPGPSILYKTQCILDLGKFDPSLSIEDWDMVLKISKYYPIAYLPLSLVNYRVLDTSLWHSKRESMYVSMNKIMIKHYKSLPQKEKSIALGHIQKNMILLFKKRRSLKDIFWFWFLLKNRPSMKNLYLFFSTISGVRLKKIEEVKLNQYIEG